MKLTLVLTVLTLLCPFLAFAQTNDPDPNWPCLSQALQAIPLEPGQVALPPPATTIYGHPKPSDPAISYFIVLEKNGQPEIPGFLIGMNKSDCSVISAPQQALRID